MISLSNLKISAKSHKTTKAKGRGNSSGRGNFSGRGVKGQRSRTGGTNKLKRLGMRRIIFSTPKLRGFNSLAMKPAVVNITDLEKCFKAGDKVSPRELFNKGLLDNLNAPVKILGEGQLTKSLTIVGCSFSASAIEKIKKAGGQIGEVIGAPVAKPEAAKKAPVKAGKK